MPSRVYWPTRPRCLKRPRPRESVFTFAVTPTLGRSGCQRSAGILTNADCPTSYTQGVWQHGRMLGYTSAGVGCSLLPVRYNCPPEIALIELIRK